MVEISVEAYSALVDECRSSGKEITEAASDIILACISTEARWKARLACIDMIEK